MIYSLNIGERQCAVKNVIVGGDFNTHMNLKIDGKDEINTLYIWWILWFSVRYAATTRREIFGVNTLCGKLDQLSSLSLQNIFIGGKLLCK